MGVSAAATAMGIVVAIAYAYAERIVSMLGITGARIVSRLAALILLAIGIQIFISGVQGVLVDTLRLARH